jgi:ribosomal protein S18 acetylase RimI-like enzyme
MTFFATYSTYKGRPCLYVNDLYVAPQARSRGVARLLMARVCRLAVARGCCRVELKVLGGNAAQRFYEKIGMAATEEVPFTLRDRALAALAEEDA